MLEQYLLFLSVPRSGEPEAIKGAAQNLLTPKRFAHVEGVHGAALEFAGLFGLSKTEVKNLEQAVWLHDFVKGLAIARQLELAQTLAIPLAEEALKAPPVVHGILAAWLAPRVFGIDNPSVAQAVYHHTTGHPSLDRLGQLLFLADYCEGGRAFDSSPIRALLPSKLNQALYEVTRQKIIDVLQKGGYLHSASLAYYHYLRQGLT